ncbi:Pheromone-regulated membrane protein 10 [Cytospora mali]|uniref:Pheromone-regulated membrane protein 10 n=1 Tax=Cytospora mali TaxID=578113 RepID=A0A194VT35_CYTMA|nr:Pheromone-regulated membrane protein 10 [Valsa mali]
MSRVGHTENTRFSPENPFHGHSDQEFDQTLSTASGETAEDSGSPGVMSGHDVSPQWTEPGSTGTGGGPSAAGQGSPSPHTTPGVHRRDFGTGSETGSESRDEAAPEGRARRESLRAATSFMERQVRRAQAAFTDDSSIEEPLSQASTSVPDRSASPILFDDADESALPGVGPHDGVLGVLFDMYRLHIHGSTGGRSGHSAATEYPTGDITEEAEEMIDKSSVPRVLKNGRKEALSSDEAHRTVNHFTTIIRRHISRQLYLLKLCRALMAYGAPTHRLEAYMVASALAVRVNAQFMYVPGCMMISFQDNATQTTKITMVKAAQGLDLGRMKDAHEIYLDVIHGTLNADEGIDHLEELMNRPMKFSTPVRVFMYFAVYQICLYHFRQTLILPLEDGIACASVSPYGFHGRFIDMPLAFVLGLLLGFLQLVLSPKDQLFANVFEITASILITFAARAFGSIRGGTLFCFSTLAQSGVALILPGVSNTSNDYSLIQTSWGIICVRGTPKNYTRFYIVLAASLELQTRHLIAGATRLSYAVFYTLMLGYGVTIGSALWGYMDKDATSSLICSNPLRNEWNPLFVTIFTIAVSIINQAKWKQMPIMLFIAVVGYVVNWRAGIYFKGESTVSNTLAAFTVGVLGNLYSRFGRYPSSTVEFCNKWMRPYITRQRGAGPRDVDRDLEQGTDRLGHEPTASSAQPLPQRIPLRAGYGLAAAAMLPAIFVQVPSGIAIGGSLLSGVTSADLITGEKPGKDAGTDLTTVSNVAFNVTISVVQVAISIAVGLSLSALITIPIDWKKAKKTGVSAL